MAAYTWTDSGDHLWSNLNNWRVGGSPPAVLPFAASAADAVTIGASSTVTIDTPVTVPNGGSITWSGAFTLAANAVLTFAAGSSNTVPAAVASITVGPSGSVVSQLTSGTLSLNGNGTTSVTVHGNVTNSGAGTFNVGSSSNLSTNTISYSATATATCSAGTLNMGGLGSNSSSISLATGCVITQTGGTVNVGMTTGGATTPTTNFAAAANISGSSTFNMWGAAAGGGTANINAGAEISASGTSATVNLYSSGSGAAIAYNGGSVTASAGANLRIGVPSTTGTSTTITCNGLNLNLVSAVEATLATLLARSDDMTETYSGHRRYTQAALVQAGGITPQQVADALKLRPADGTPATGSVMGMLATTPTPTEISDRIEREGGPLALTKTAAEAAAETLEAGVTVNTDGLATEASLAALAARLGSASIQVVSPVALDGSFEIVQGDDVPLAWSRPWTTAAPASADLRIVSGADYETGAAGLVKACSIQVDAGILTVSVTLTAAETMALATTPPTPKKGLMAQVVLTVDGKKSTLLLTTATVRKRVG